MADETKVNIDGSIDGKPISQETKNKIQDVLKTTVQQELTTQKAAVGATRGVHGSVHGSIVYIE
jgi:hypothetical protein